MFSRKPADYQQRGCSVVGQFGMRGRLSAQCHLVSRPVSQILHSMTLMFKTEAVSGGGFPRWGSQSWLPPRFYAASSRLKAGCRLKVCPTNSENQSLSRKAGELSGIGQDCPPTVKPTPGWHAMFTPARANSVGARCPAVWSQVCSSNASGGSARFSGLPRLYSPGPVRASS